MWSLLLLGRQQLWQRRGQASGQQVRRSHRHCVQHSDNRVAVTGYCYGFISAGKQATTGAGPRGGQSGKRGVLEGQSGKRGVVEGQSGKRGVVEGQSGKRGVLEGQSGKRGVLEGDTHFDDESVSFSCAVLVFYTRDAASACSIECE